MKPFLLVACMGALVLGAFVAVSANQLEGGFGGDGVTSVEIAPDASSYVWFEADADPDELRRGAFENCALQSVESLADALGTKPTARAVARDLARRTGEPTVYRACMLGFRD